MIFWSAAAAIFWPESGDARSSMPTIQHLTTATASCASCGSDEGVDLLARRRFIVHGQLRRHPRGQLPLRPGDGHDVYGRRRDHGRGARARRPRPRRAPPGGDDLHARAHEVSPPDDADTSDAELPAAPPLGRRASPSPRKPAMRRAAPKPSPQGARLPPAPKRGRGSGSPAAPARPGSSASTLTLRPRAGLRSDANGRAIHERPFR